MTSLDVVVVKPQHLDRSPVYLLMSCLIDGIRQRGHFTASKPSFPCTMSMMSWLLPKWIPTSHVARSAGRSKNELKGHAKEASYVAPVAKHHLPDAPSSSARTYSQANARMTVASPLSNAKKPPGNRVAFSLGRIVPTEARPSELSWRHSMGGLLGCQGQMIFTVNDRLYVTC